MNEKAMTRARADAMFDAMGSERDRSETHDLNVIVGHRWWPLKTVKLRGGRWYVFLLMRDPREEVQRLQNERWPENPFGLSWCRIIVSEQSAGEASVARTQGDPVFVRLRDGSIGLVRYHREVTHLFDSSSTRAYDDLPL